MMAFTLLRAIVLVLAVAPFVFALIAIYSAWRFSRTRRPIAGTFTPPVSILKPVRGLDSASYENFATFCRQDYPDYEIVFGVADADDPVIPVMHRLIADFPARAIRLLIGAPTLGPSSKVNKLCRLSAEARHELLVINDSDIRVGPDYLRSVVAPFRDAEVGAVTCLYVGHGDGYLAGELEAIGIATDFAAGVLTARQLEGVAFTLGATMATSKARLGEIGGFEALVDYCAEDFELGYRLAARGHRVELSPYVVASECPARTLREYLRHQLRWAISTRHSRPWGYTGLLLTQGLPWAVAAAVVAPSGAVAASYLGAYVVLRLAMAWSVAVWGLGDAGAVRRWWLLPLRDALGFLVWLGGLFGNRIHWRGREFLVDRGRLIPVTPRAAGAAPAGASTGASL